MTPAALATAQAAILDALKRAGLTLRRIEAPMLNGQGDEGDHALASERTAEAFGTRERMSGRIAACLAALARMEQGVYGRCLDCDAEISAARLAFDPTVATCVRCQERREFATTRLGGD